MTNIKELKDLIQKRNTLEVGIIDKHIEKIRLLENSFDTGPSVFYLFNLSSLEFEYLSPGFEKLTGYKISDLKNSSLLPFIDLIDSNDARVLIKEVYPQFRAFRKNYEANEILLQAFQVSYRLRKKNGQLIRTLQQYHFIELDQDNSPLLTFGRNTEVFLPSEFEQVTAAIQMLKKNHFDLVFQEVYPSSDIELSIREKEVLKLLVNGSKSQEIADQLFISINTIKRHRQNMLEKLNIDSTNEMIKYAVLHGIY